MSSMITELHPMDHFSKEYSPELLKFAKDHVFRKYIFVRINHEKPGKKRIGYCTYCGKEFSAHDMKHKTEKKCPACGTECIVIHDWRGHTKLVDEAYFVFYEKSSADPSVVVARGVFGVKDYRKEFRNIKMQLTDKTRYIFDIGHPIMFKRYAWYCTWELPRRLIAGEFKKTSKIYSDFSSYYMKNNVIIKWSRDSISDAIDGTPFKYSTWEHYNYEDMTRFFGLYAKYPCIEYLTKMGLDDCVMDKLCERLTYGAINWNGKSIEKVLRMSKNQFKAIRNTNIDSYFLRLYQITIKEGSNLSRDEIEKIKDDFSCNYIQEVEFVRKFSSLTKIHTYVCKQFEKGKKDKHYYSIHTVLSDYKDYLKGCVTLRMNMRSESVLFPKNLYNAHQNTIKQVKIKASAYLEEKIGKRADTLDKKYSFQMGNFLIRPAKSAAELIEEGKALNHCVGTYAENYSKGSTNILFIRNVSQPDKSFYTLELDNSGHIRQVRGKNNVSTTHEVDDFIDCWLSEKIEKKEIRIMVPA